jgi:hypothetical protein
MSLTFLKVLVGCLIGVLIYTGVSIQMMRIEESKRDYHSAATQEELLRKETERQAILKADWQAQGSTILARVRGLIKEKQYDAAVQEANPFLSVGDPELKTLHDQAQAVILEREREIKEKILKREREAKEKIESAAKQVFRENYKTVLREIFLDQGMDIKVSISGKQSDRLTLTFVLFNDVWVHRFQKDGIVEQWREMGFNRVDIKDGYDYYQYWTF